MKKATLLFALTISWTTLGETQEFPYPPAIYRTPICFPDDWQKSLVDHHGKLNYDFGPGPYARPKTEVAIGVKGKTLNVTDQKLYHARVPIVMTELEASGVSMQQEAFALLEEWYPDIPKDPNFGFPVKRFLGFTGAAGWAQPTQICDPAFRNVTTGTGRPIRYSIAVASGSRKQVALGFCDSYRKKGKTKRVMKLEVEGAESQEIDLLVSGAQNQPQAFIFDARDTNNDGQLDIEIKASARTHDPNILLNVIWVFSADFSISMPELIAGSLTSSAETYVDCGLEPQLLQMPQRRDAIIVTIAGSEFTPEVHIKTNRELDFDSHSGTLLFQQQPYIATQPVAVGSERTTDGWLLEMPKNKTRIEVVVFNGKLQNVALPNLQAEKEKSVSFWQDQVALPWNNLLVPDARLQPLLESSVRVLYQVREYVDGYPQFQPGPSVYRGFWASDGIWDADAAMLIGDFEAAQFTVDRFIEHQNANGRIEIMSPTLLHRETAHFIWLLHRYTSLTQDKAWLLKHWEYLEKAVAHYQQLRQDASVDPEQPYFGLTPPGLTDGGIGGINAEYGGVYWGLIGIKAAIESAVLLGKTNQAEIWQLEFDDFLTAFRRAAERDMRSDKQGSKFLPMKMMQEGEIRFPQRGQGQLCHLIFPGKIFGREEPFIDGMLTIFEHNLVQGLVIDAGWLKGGVWPFFAVHRGLAELWVGRAGRAQAALNAFADHASPTLLWVEEQKPLGKGTRVAGDTPQTNANAQLIRLLRHLLILERGNSLQLFPGLPYDWLRPNAELAFTGLPTTFGELHLNLRISQDGDAAVLKLEPIEKWGQQDTLAISLAALKSQGFRLSDDETTPDIWYGKLDENIILKFTK